MSKIKYSALVSDVRNKLNGSVLSKNRYGNYIRNKTTPVNPQTPFQQNARAQLAANSQAWGGLTEAQRLSFKALAAELPFTDIFGDSKILAANSMFVKLNGNLVKIGQPTISVAPAKIAVPAITVVSLTATAGAGVLATLALAFLASPIPAGFTAVVYATPGISPGKSFVKNQFRLLRTINAASSSPTALITAYAARFGNPASGLKIFVRVVLVSNATGQQGVASEGMTIIP